MRVINLIPAHLKDTDYRSALGYIVMGEDRIIENTPKAIDKALDVAIDDISEPYGFAATSTSTKPETWNPEYQVGTVNCMWAGGATIYVYRIFNASRGQYTY